LVSISLPIFLVSALTLSYLGYNLELFPSGGYVGLTEDPLDWAYHLVLPWTTLAVLFIGLYARVLRANLLATMDEDFVRTARAKGLTEHRVRRRHVLRNALLPIVTLLGLDFAALIGGAAIITEYIFNLQGIGQLAADAAIELDLPPIMAVSLFAAFFVVLLNTLVDIAYTWLDPRIRLERSR
jgi:peptide/nickel transport system permease protein